MTSKIEEISYSFVSLYGFFRPLEPHIIIIGHRELPMVLTKSGSRYSIYSTKVGGENRAEDAFSGSPPGDYQAHEPAYLDHVSVR